MRTEGPGNTPGTPPAEGGKKKEEGAGKGEGISEEEYNKLSPEEKKKYIPDPENPGKYIEDPQV